MFIAEDSKRVIMMISLGTNSLAWEEKSCICKTKEVKLKYFSSEFDMEISVCTHEIFILLPNLAHWKGLKTMTKPVASGHPKHPNRGL